MVLGKSISIVRCYGLNFRRYFKTIAATALAAFFISGSIQGASVTTNTQIYVPGETVTILGSGFQTNEIVRMVVTQDGNSTTSVSSWSVSANSSGGFEANWIFPSGDYLGTIFLVSATGESSGLEASATFMGGNTILEILLMFPQPLCIDTLTSADSIVICAKLLQGCPGPNAPLPGREVLFFFSHGGCGANVGQNAFDTATTDANGVACIAVHGADTLFSPTETSIFRAKFLGEDKPGPGDPPNSACDPDDRAHLSASNDCLQVQTTENCQGWLTFNQRELFAVDVFAMKTADINRDNFTDIVFCGTDATPGLFVFLAIDANNFNDPTSCLGIQNAALDIDFINTDSLPDIVATTLDSIYILLNGGQATSCESWTLVALPNSSKTAGGQERLAGSGVPAVISAYFNDDSKLDLFVGPSSIYFGDGTGNFSSSSSIPVSAISAAAADFNSDGNKDLLAVDIDSAYILINDGIGNFAVAASLFVDTGYVSISVDNAVGDFDGDCNFDFLVTIPNVDSSELSVLHLGYGDGLGNLEQTESIVINGVVQDVIVIDVDRDSILDIIVSNGTARRVEIYLGNGDRTFGLLEFLSIDLAGDSPFSLASADFDRDGQPDFISSSNVNGNLLLSTNNLADLPVLPDELVVTALTNTTMRITNPLGYQTSEQVQTIAGGDIWSLDVNGDDLLDEQVIDYNLLAGEYELTFFLSPEFDDGSTTQPLSSSVRIDGSQQATIFDSYTYSSSAKALGDRSQGCLPTSITFTYLVGEDSSLYYPFNGIQTNSSQPTFYWGGLLPAKSQPINRFHLQVDSRLDFPNPVINDSNLVSELFMPCTTLFEIGDVYYWHIRWHDGVSWSEFSNTFAVYVGGNCCIGIKGDVNGDGKNANIIDLTFIVDFIFRGGDCTGCAEEADISGDGEFNVVDLTSLVDYIFRSGRAPGVCY